MKPAESPQFADAVFSRALQHYAAVDGWSLYEPRELSRGTDGSPAVITTQPQEFLRTFLTSRKSSTTSLQFLHASEFSMHSVWLGKGAGPINRSFGDLQAAIRKDGAVVLEWTGSRLEFDAFERRHVLAWLHLCGLHLEHEDWSSSSLGHFWLAGPVTNLATTSGAEKIIEALIRRYGNVEATVTLKQMERYPSREVPRTEDLRRWRFAVASATFKSPLPTRQPLTVFDFVAALRRARSESPRGFVSVNQFRERYFQAQSAEFELLLNAASTGGLVRAVKVPDANAATHVVALELIDSAGAPRNEAD